MSYDPPNMEHITQHLLGTAYHPDGRLRRVPKQLELTERDLQFLVGRARAALQQDSMLLEVEGSVNIVGDLHGQFLDLMRIFDALGRPPTQRYLFMGDYVDRGSHSLETICMLLALKVMYPDKVFLLRGNHESAEISRVYGFYDECKRRFSVQLWRLFVHLFRFLPIAAVVGQRIFCVHGGLSPKLDLVQKIKLFHRPLQLMEGHLAEEILWSDPNPQIKGWGASPRGVSFTYGMEALQKFLDENELDLVCRGHEVVEDGYEFMWRRKLLTIFSATNYCGQFDNSGAVLRVDGKLVCSLFILKPLYKLGRG